ncbi:MAG: hypothetical protein KF764_20700 [Labilithrix sp.]|nr:hypothetical protein [Labilithrix sp.]
MRRALFGWLVAAVCTGVACASDPPADATNERPDSGEVTAPELDGGDGPPFDVPACVVATGEGPASASELADDTGTASVAVEGTGCARSFALSSTAVRRDDLPASPRVLAEQAGGPSVQTTSPLFDALYQLALDEAKECSVDSIKDYAFNDGAELRCAEGGCFETGRKWNYVWTRDTAYAVDLGLPWVDAVRAKNSLELKISTRRDGKDLQIVQDTGTGGSYPVSTDRVVWALGAREVLLHLTGEARTKFRDRALEAAKNTIAHDRVVAFDARDGLYRGEQSFLDWREQSYPGWASPDTVHIGMSKSLSTNVAHLSLIDLAAALAEETGDSATATAMKGRAADLRAAIRARFWLTEEKQLSTFVTTELDPSPVRRFDLLGTSLAVLLDVTTPAQAKDAVATYPTLPKGPPVFFPQQKDTPIYHNRAIWPFVTAYWVKAAKKVGNDAAFDAGIRSLVRGAALNLSNMENLEVVTGKPWHDDGAASGPVVNSQRQLWSVAGYIGAVNGGLFGVEAVPGGVRVAPFLPRSLRASLFGKAETIALNDLPFRGKKLSVSLKLPADGGGASGAYVVRSRRLNGRPLAGEVIAEADLRERNLVEIELGAPASPAAALHAIDDTSDYRTIFAPRTPSVAGIDVSGGKLRVTADFSGESATEITWSVYRDGVRVASGLGANTTTWTDAATNGDASPSHCYTVETRWGTSGNVSQHARPHCFWGPGSQRVTSVAATSFSVTGGAMTTAYGRTFPESWGDPGHEIVATFDATRSGAHLVQAVYGNGAGPLSTGITCAVKKVTVEELPSGTAVGTGYLVMPQRADWASWGDSSFVRVNLEANKSYRVRLSHDDRAVNMSAFEHFSAYTGGTGGKAGAFFRVNVAELKLLAL